jgi:hypothetical protein
MRRATSRLTGPIQSSSFFSPEGSDADAIGGQLDKRAVGLSGGTSRSAMDSTEVVAFVVDAEKILGAEKQR